MSTARIEKLFKESTQDFIPVPRLPIKDIKEDALSKKLRQFDNAKIVVSPATHSGVYINTNEHGVTNTSNTLANIPFIPKPFHIGFSGWHNFDIMAQRQSARGLICDINPENALFLHYALTFVRACNNRLQFIKQITNFIKENSYVGARTNTNKAPLLGKVSPFSVKFSLNVSDEPPFSDHYSVIEEVELELKRKTSWLYTDDRYNHIRKLALEDKIAFITESICAVDIFNNISRVLRDNMIQIDTVYVSNISEWIDTSEERSLFFKTIQLFLTDKETILIDGRTLSTDSLIPTQRVITHRELKLSNLEKWFYQKTAEVREGRDEEVQSDNLILSALSI